MPEILVEETPLKEDSYSNCYGRTLDIPIIISIGIPIPIVKSIDILSPIVYPTT